MFVEKYDVVMGNHLPNKVSIVPDGNNADFFLNDMSPLLSIEAEDKTNPMGEWRLNVRVSILQLNSTTKVFPSYGDAISVFTKLKNHLSDICEKQKKIEFLERQLERTRAELEDSTNSFYSCNGE